MNTKLSIQWTVIKSKQNNVCKNSWKYNLCSPNSIYMYINMYILVVAILVTMSNFFATPWTVAPWTPELVMDREAWRAAVHGVTKSRTRLSGWTELDRGPLGFSVHGISQARILERVVISFSKGSSWRRDWTRVSCIKFSGDKPARKLQIIYMCIMYPVPKYGKYWCQLFYNKTFKSGITNKYCKKYYQGHLLFHYANNH